MAKQQHLTGTETISKVPAVKRAISSWVDARNVYLTAKERLDSKAEALAAAMEKHLKPLVKAGEPVRITVDVLGQRVTCRLEPQNDRLATQVRQLEGERPGKGGDE